MPRLIRCFRQCCRRLENADTRLDSGRISVGFLPDAAVYFFQLGNQLIPVLKRDQQNQLVF